MVYFLKCNESAPTADSAVYRFLKKDWQMKVPNRAAVIGVDYPAALSIISPYPAFCGRKASPTMGGFPPSPFGQFDKKVCKTKPNFFYDYEENVVDGHSFT